VIEVASLSSGNATRDEHLRSERWLDAAQFPTMRFQSTSVLPAGESAADVTGDLTLHGVTAPVTLHVTLNQFGPAPNNQRPAAGFSATGTVSRTVFGIATAPQLIGDEVTITIEALAQPPES
jgi:polyisoprenoid-binding protein YceI